MYGHGLLQGEAAVKAAKEKFEVMKQKYLPAQGFFTYFEKEWIWKIEMWVTGFRSIPHANQDTNAAVESYHANLKSILAMSRQKFTGRRVDWLIYHLVGDVLTHYWYAVQCKLYGFIKNGKAEGIVANAVLRARNIPDEDVLICEDQTVAFVASQTDFPQVWTVTNPNTDWAHCDCYLGMRENVCKHAMKVFKMINKDVENGAIIRYAGTLRGTIGGGYDTLGMDAFAAGRLVQDKTFEDTTGNDRTRTSNKADDPEKVLAAVKSTLANLELLAVENPSLRAHILSNIIVAKGKVLDFKAKSASGLLHPASQPSFEIRPGSRNLRRFKSRSETGWKGSRNTS